MTAFTHNSSLLNIPSFIYATPSPSRFKLRVHYKSSQFLVASHIITCWPWHTHFCLILALICSSHRF